MRSVIAPHPISELPAANLGLEGQLVPIVRSLLKKGLPEEVLRSSVRIAGFQPFGGGLKADLVGGLRIDFAAVLKVGTDELALHDRYMSGLDAAGVHVFPKMLAHVRLEGGKHVLVMEELRKHHTLLSWVFEERTPIVEMERMVERIGDALRNLRSAGARIRRQLKLGETRNPYGPRLRQRLEPFRRDFPTLFESAGMALGTACPPLDELIVRAEKWKNEAVLTRDGLTLAHGDLHLGNVMLRRYGKGHRVRFIDPNPLIGFTDSAYDFGKLLHWSEPVGWTRIDAPSCVGKFIPATKRSGWQLDASRSHIGTKAEQRRATFETILREGLADIFGRNSAQIALSTASAHSGLLPLTIGIPQRLFVLAHTVAALARAWAPDFSAT